MFFIAAIVIVIVLAVVVKPIMNGETVQILPDSKSNTISNIPVPSGAPTTPYTSVLSRTTLTPTPTPVWNGAPKTVQFVDPSTYNIQWSPEIRDFGFRMPGYEEPENNSFITYATINGQWDATTQVINIPFPYWEIEVSLESIGDVGSTDIETSINYLARMIELEKQYNIGAISLQEYNALLKDLQRAEELYGSEGAGGEVEGLFASGGESIGVETENQYNIIPSVNIQVADADKPNGIIYILNSRTEGPVPKVKLATGGLDDEEPEDVLFGEEKESVLDEDVISRENINEYIWKHRFYEGEGNYYFIINPNMLKSYKIDIKVPGKYLSS
ncbi:MAG: hypothetical protein PHV39_08820 [Methanomicrobium sp.]|nr:hypothetical protein [Methanomicrobium sp.]